MGERRQERTFHYIGLERRAGNEDVVSRVVSMVEELNQLVDRLSQALEMEDDQ